MCQRFVPASPVCAAAALTEKSVLSGLQSDPELALCRHAPT